LSNNFVAFEYGIVDGLPDPIVKDRFIEVPDRSGMGAELVSERARRYLGEDDRAFFD
jgi:L-alanine-DL-glutamate epimerase-like enolase superfamily enzyme